MYLKKEEDYRIALLVDAENVSNKYADAIFGSLAKYGRIVVKNAYLSITEKGQIEPEAWQKTCQNKGMRLVAQARNSKGKNSVDSKLIIDAMDILHTNKDVNCFCLASSDGDFTTLASRLRETGNYLIGMGERKTIMPLRKVCDEFVELETISNEQDNELEKYKTNFTDGDNVPPVPKEFIESAIKKMIIDNMTFERETTLGEIANQLKRIYPDFNTRNYGTSKFSKFIASFTSLTVINNNIVELK